MIVTTFDMILKIKLYIALRAIIRKEGAMVDEPKGFLLTFLHFPILLRLFKNFFFYDTVVLVVLIHPICI